MVREVGVALCRQRIRVAEKPAHNLQAEAARNEMRCMGMAVVMKAVVAKARLFGDIPPKLFDAP